MPSRTRVTCRSSSTTCPSRTGTNVDAATFLRLAEHPRVIAVKEASGNLEQMATICRERPRDVAVLAGDDAWTLPLLALGGDGVVSVASNEIPGELVALCAAARAGDWDAARRTHERWLPLFLANFAGAPNPVPAKAALALMGLLEHDAVRQPLLPLDPDARAALAVTLRCAGPRRARRRPHRVVPGGRGMTTDAVASADLGSVDAVLDGLEAGAIRAAHPDPSAPGGWRVDAAVKAAILEAFRDRTSADWAAGPLTFRDRAAFPPRDLRDGPWRIVPGGTAVRRGAHLEPDVVIMPPSYVNVGAWVGTATMVDSHVLVGSCAQIGARVHLGAGVTIGGVLEPPGARPVIVEDDAFVGAGSALLEGVLVGRSAVIGAGVTLTGTSRLYDLVRGAVLDRDGGCAAGRARGRRRHPGLARRSTTRSPASTA